MNRAALRTLLAIIGGWVAIITVVSLTRPVMPVDETRYMTVAWEMLVRHNWLLPTLNFEAYSHKPPLLFWLINTGWALFGMGMLGPRIILAAIIGSLSYLTYRLARTLFPQSEATPRYAMLALASMPLFLLYASSIMFDSLLAVSVTLAQFAIWRAARDGGLKPWLLLGLAIGIGALTKGPVTLVYMLPTALFAPLWFEVSSRRNWYGGVALAIVIGTAIGLAWAIPSAMQGGAAYAQKIFVTQSAGRMVNAFDHVEPFWFYLPALAGFLFPFLVWPTLWSGVRSTWREANAHKPIRFLLCWVVPVFLFFSIISSKQVHYLIPILPGIAILIAYALANSSVTLRPRVLLWPLAAMLVPSISVIVHEMLGKPFFGILLSPVSEYIGLAHIAVTLGVYLWAQRSYSERALPALALAACAMLVMVHVQLAPRFLPLYNFAPLADAIVPYKDGPIAVMPKYDGEYGYVLKLTKGMDPIEKTDAAAWFAAHPNGVAIVRDNTKDNMTDGYEILFSQPYRGTKRISIIRPKTPPHQLATN